MRCGNEEYDGYFCHPSQSKSGKWPAVLFLGGADAYAEEIYFGGKQMLDRGWAMLLVDTPGRGSSIYLKGIKTRPDYEVPGKACIDYLVSRPEVDPNRVALLGISMAGYYAPRVAAFEKRLKALVAWSGCYSILDDLYDLCVHLQPVCQRLLRRRQPRGSAAIVERFHHGGDRQEHHLPDADHSRRQRHA